MAKAVEEGVREEEVARKRRTEGYSLWTIGINAPDERVFKVCKKLGQIGKEISRDKSFGKLNC